MSYKPLLSWPPISRSEDIILELKPRPYLGLDLEWGLKTEQPTIIGQSDGTVTVSCSFDDGIGAFNELLKRSPFAEIVGHNVVSADVMVLRKLGINIPLNRVEDTIIRHWLVNMHLCKTTKKAGLEEDAGEKKGRGFMNLGTVLSLYTDLRYYKECRGARCEGPCPEHSPFEYNGTDALGPVIAIPKLKTACKLRGVEHLYPMHRELAMVLAEMSERGLKIDVDYVDQLRTDFIAQKTQMKEEFPFNPQSPQQVMAFFKARGVELEDAKEETIRDAVEEYPDDEVLDQFLMFKELGNGPDRWFAKREWVTKTPEGKPCSPHWAGFVDGNGYVHPRLGMFTSSGRLMCADPNFQNVPKRRLDRRNCACGHTIKLHEGKCTAAGCECKRFNGINLGKKLRRAVIAPEGYYIIRADYSNGENRVYLYLAGYPPPKGDLHQWMTENIGIAADHPFALKMGSPRDAAKSVTHATDYGEGLQLKTLAELRTPAIRNEISKGARVVCSDWRFEGKIVTFTGANLAQRAFGSKTLENRRLALEIQERYIAKFPGIRALQKRITKQIENERMVRPPHGYALLSYGRAEDRIKQALAVWGSQPVAHLSKVALLNLDRHWKQGRPVDCRLQIHDEMLAYTPEKVDPKIAGMWLRGDMEIETPEMKGFVLPAEASYGPNWAAQTKLK